MDTDHLSSLTIPDLLAIIHNGIGSADHLVVGTASEQEHAAQLALADLTERLNTPEVGDKIFVLFTWGTADPVPITTCATFELAEQYLKGLSLLPEEHPLRTDGDRMFIGEIPLLRKLPQPILDVLMDHS